MLEIISAALQDAKETLGKFLSDKKNVELINQSVELFATALAQEHKAISCGNGGSMCDAMHFAEELTGRFRKDRPPLPAMAISDSSHLSCVGNDYGYDQVFARYVMAHGKTGDVLLAISTSGNSPNIINAVTVAKQKQMKTVGLLGKDGGKLKEMVDVPLIIPHHSSDRIQEIHIKLIHIFIEGIERKLFPQNY